MWQVTSDTQTHAAIDYLVAAEGLQSVRLTQKPGHRKHIGARVHHDKEVCTGQVESRHHAVVGHHLGEQGGHFLNDHGFKG